MNKNSIAYTNYFKTHYKYVNFQEGIESYQQWFHGQLEFMKKRMSVSTTAKIFEVGSGIGGFYSVIQNEGYDITKYTGLELDAEATEFSNQHFQVECFINKSLEQYESKKRFDCVFAFEVLEHLTNPLADLNKIYKLLDTNGTLVATSPFPFLKNILADETHLFVLHPENWKRLLHLAQFKEVFLYPMSFIPFLWRIDKKINCVIPFYIPFSKFISTCLIIAKK